MVTRLIGTDTANPRLPALVIAATQGASAADLAPGNVAAGMLTQTASDARYAAVCQVHDATQNIINNSLTMVVFDSDEQLDPLGWHDNATNPSRVTPNVAGWYRVFGQTEMVAVQTTITRMQITVVRNGAGLHSRQQLPNTVSLLWGMDITTELVSMNGTTDFFELQIFQVDSGSATRSMQSWMTVELVRAT